MHIYIYIYMCIYIYIYDIGTRGAMSCGSRGRPPGPRKQPRAPRLRGAATQGIVLTIRQHWLCVQTCGDRYGICGTFASEGERSSRPCLEASDSPRVLRTLGYGPAETCW